MSKAWMTAAVMGVMTGACVCDATAQEERPIKPAEVRSSSGTARVHGGQGRGDGAFSATRTYEWNPRYVVTAVSPAGKMEKAPYLGVTSTRVTPVLRSNLKLQPGVGLVVEQVQADSPAAEAGLKQYDILQKFNDQILISPQQLGVLVRIAKAGEDVSLTLLREGNTETVRLKLTEKEQPPLDDAAGFLSLRDFNAVTVPGGAAGGNNPFSEQWLDAKAEASAKKAMDILRAKGSSNNATFSYVDPEHTLEITRKDGGRRLVAKDKDGKVLFEGPITTEVERKALPPAVAEKLKALDERTKAVGAAEDGTVRVRVVRPGEVQDDLDVKVDEKRED